MAKDDGVELRSTFAPENIQRVLMGPRMSMVSS